jgi:hypothetical protein
VHFDRYGYGLLMKKLFTGFINSSQYTTKVIFHNPGNFCNYRIFELLLFKKNFKFELNFSDSTNYEKFLKTLPNIMKKWLIFTSNFFTVCVLNQRKKHFKTATLTFRVGDHIFCICYLKNHMTCFWDFRSKLFGNISKIFPISCSKFFKLIFLKSSAKNIGNGYFHLIQICLRFVSLLLFIL